MAIDHIILIVVGLVSILGGLHLLYEAKAYRARHHQEITKRPHLKAH